MVVIKSKKDGFRRCGIAHPAAEVEYPDDRFTEEELEILKAEPMLIVTNTPLIPLFDKEGSPEGGVVEEPVGAGSPRPSAKKGKGK